MRGDTANGVVESQKQRKIPAPIRISDIGRNAVLVLLEDFQGRVNRIVGQIQKPRLRCLPIDETDRLIGKQVGGVAIELLHLAAAINHVVRMSRAEHGLGVLVQDVVMATDEKTNELVEAA